MNSFCDAPSNSQSDLAELFVIVSLKWTRPRDQYVTFWRPNRQGYCWPLSWAGLYSEAEAREIDSCADSDAIAVPAAVVFQLSRAPKPNTVDGDAGPIVGRWLLNALKRVRLAPASQSNRKDGATKTTSTQGRGVNKP